MCGPWGVFELKFKKQVLVCLLKVTIYTNIHFSEMERQAAKIASEIDGGESSRSRAELENGDENEEDAFRYMLSC